MTNNDTKPRLQAHYLTFGASESEIIPVHRVSQAAFPSEILPETIKELPEGLQLSTWMSRLTLPHAAIIYTTNTNQPQTDQVPLGFFYALPRIHPEIGFETMHISLAGVDPASRGLGIFPILTDEVRKHARSCGYKTLTVCTFPNKFEKMYRILGQHGWEVVAWRESGEKVLMKMEV